MPGLLPGRVAFLCKGARANVRGATLLMQGCLSICGSDFYNVMMEPEHLAELLHRLGDGAGAFAGATFTK